MQSNDTITNQIIISIWRILLHKSSNYARLTAFHDPIFWKLTSHKNAQLPIDSDNELSQDWAHMVSGSQKYNRNEKGIRWGVAIRRQTRNCPRNCKRWATPKSPLNVQNIREGLGKHRPASQETCHIKRNFNPDGVFGQETKMIYRTSPSIFICLDNTPRIRGGRYGTEKPQNNDLYILQTYGWKLPTWHWTRQ